MEIPCYICDKAVDIDRIVGHLRSHTDLESRIAYQKVIKEKVARNVRKRGSKVEGNGPVAPGARAPMPRMPKAPEPSGGNEPTKNLQDSPPAP